MAELSEVKTKVDQESKETIWSAGRDDLQACKLCLQAASKYTCPRCNMGYCSLLCYQSEKHAACSESFYKECVLDELKDMSSSSGEKQKVLKMLTEDLDQRAEDESDDDSEDNLADRLQDLDIDKDISAVWSRLNRKEKEEFARMLQDGRLARLIEIWIPWWYSKENNKLVREELKIAAQPTGQEMPEILSDIPDINTLLKNSRPSAECRFELINILFGYCFVSRIHNGCHMECPVDSTHDFLDLCVVLRNQCGCGSLGEAIQNAFDDLAKKDKESSLKFKLTVLEDVKIIISGPGPGDNMTFMTAALSDLIVLLRTALNVVKKELRSQSKTGETESDKLKTLKSQVFKSEKKVLFLLSWLIRYGMAMHQLLPLLQFEIETRQSEAEEIEEIKAAVETHMDKLTTTDSTGNGTKETKTTTSKIVELN